MTWHSGPYKISYNFHRKRAQVYSPVVRILTHPGDGASGRLNNTTNASYIAASYVKFVESAGARAIPIVYDESQAIIVEKLSLVNRVPFIGGWAKTGF
ncbi:Gamma-glutamyl hydrolase [Thalictrum thalictroides]|uniref:folate gamma-glutamyl hydrolase n=1 Tax=Thalictrum thalictroides TaxID=46969 RepID=A0A7J6WIK8_THATH|nr:Gamma-glutamyl hydrolase [Thalictrum thalictroides]